jgi:SAM-dependent methyltransferase
VALGWDCYGIEPSDFVSEIARKKNIKILDKSMLDIDENNKFDFIFMDNVIEHLDYPGQYVEKASDLLNESGVIVIKTPNSSGLLEQLEYTVLSYLPQFISKGIMKFLHKRYSIGSGTVHRFGNLHPPVHLSLFNRKSITKVLTTSGFKNKNIKVLSGSEYYHLWRVKRPTPKGLFSKFLKILKRLGDLTKKGDMLITVAHK